MRRATGLRKACDRGYRAERQGGGCGGLCWRAVELLGAVVRLVTKLQVGRCVSEVVGYYKQTPAGRRMSRADVAFGMQSGVREGLWLSCLVCRGGELAISDKKIT